MTLPRMAALNAYWREHPPAHLLLAAYVGYQPQRQEKATRQTLRQMRAALGA